MKWLCALLLIPLSLFSQTTLSFEGYLGAEELAKVRRELQVADDDLVLIVSSTSGDLNEVFRVAYEIRERKSHITVYIDEKAIGPGAVIPFLADELHVTAIAEWGDVLHNYTGDDGKGLVRSLLNGLVTSDSKRRLTDVMVDEEAVLDIAQMKELGLIAEVSPAPEDGAIFEVRAGVAISIRALKNTSLLMQIKTTSLVLSILSEIGLLISRHT